MSDTTQINGYAPYDPLTQSLDSPRDDQDTGGSLAVVTLPDKPGPLGRFLSTFGLGRKEEDDFRQLSKRSRRKESRQVTDQSSVEEMAISAGMSVGELVRFLASTNKEDDAVIDSFNDENEHPIGTAMHHFWTAVFYLAPPVVAMVVGWYVGLNFGGTPATIMLCLLFEAIPIVLMLATAKQLSRALSGVRSAWLGVSIIGMFFLLIAVGSSIAQWTLFEGRINTHDFAQLVGAIVRTFTLPLAEIVASVALPFLRKKSLDSHLHILGKRNDAKIQSNQKKIQNRIQLINAAIKTKSDLQKEEDYQKKQDLANKLIDLVTAKIIRDAEKSLDASPAPSNNSYRRDGYR
jgi:hypothetical protein